jgi:hypothetical protein
VRFGVSLENAKIVGDALKKYKEYSKKFDNGSEETKYDLL